MNKNQSLTQHPMTVVTMLLMLATVVGCVEHKWRDVEFQITDKLTRQPIENATVRLSYEWYIWFVLNLPGPRGGNTDANGKVILKHSEFRPGLVHIDVSRDGFKEFSAGGTKTANLLPIVPVEPE